MTWSAKKNGSRYRRIFGPKAASVIWTGSIEQMALKPRVVPIRNDIWGAKIDAETVQDTPRKASIDLMKHPFKQSVRTTF
jgi:hypothetical protein